MNWIVKLWINWLGIIGNEATGLIVQHAMIGSRGLFRPNGLNVYFIPPLTPKHTHIHAHSHTHAHKQMKREWDKKHFATAHSNLHFDVFFLNLPLISAICTLLIKLCNFDFNKCHVGLSPDFMLILIEFPSVYNERDMHGFSAWFDFINAIDICTGIECGMAGTRLKCMCEIVFLPKSVHESLRGNNPHICYALLAKYLQRTTLCLCSFQSFLFCKVQLLVCWVKRMCVNSQCSVLT